MSDAPPLDSSRCALLMGATRGIGRAVAAELARRGWALLIVGRSRDAGESIARQAVADGARAATFLPCDVSLQSAVRELAAQVRVLTPTLDLVVHTADVLRTTRLNTPEGIELAFATNCLSRVLLNSLLIDTLKPGGFVVHVAAAGLSGRISPESIPPSDGVSAIAAHNLGQRANDIYGLGLAERVAARGIRVMVMQPGMVATSIRTSNSTNRFLRVVAGAAEALLRPLMTRPDDYAIQLLGLIEQSAAAGSIASVLYDRRFQSMKVPRKYSDPALALAVWNKLHEAVGVDPNEISSRVLPDVRTAVQPKHT